MSWYCSTQCQIMDWKQGGHKQKCRALLQSTAEEAQKNRSVHVARRAKDISDAQAEEAELSNCAICLERPEDPAELPCGHEFCKACIDALRKYGVQKACPLCRKPLPPSAERLREQATRLYIKVARQVSRGFFSWSTLPPSFQRMVKNAIVLFQESAVQGHAIAQSTCGGVVRESCCSGTCWCAV